MECYNRKGGQQMIAVRPFKVIVWLEVLPSCPMISFKKEIIPITYLLLDKYLLGLTI